MKYLILITFCIQFLNCFAQDYDERIDYSPYGLTYGYLNANMRSLAPHQQLTQFTFFDMNFVNIRLQNFLENELSLIMVGEPTEDIKKDKYCIIERYEKGIQINHSKPYYIKVIYNLYPEGKNLIIKSCEISGYWNYIVDLYIKYWNTTLNFEAAKKGEIVVNYLMQDRISLSLNAQNETGKISIVNTTIKNIAEYNEIIKKAEIKHQKYIADKHQEIINNENQEKELILKKEIEKKQQELEKLNAFLIERKTKSYDLSEFDNLQSKSINLKIKEIISNHINNSTQVEYSFKGNLIIAIDTNNIITYDSNLIKTNNKEQLSKLIEEIKRSINIKTPLINGYKVNSIIEYPLDICFQSRYISFKLNKSQDFKYKDFVPEISAKKTIERKYLNSNSGKYTVEYIYATNNDIQIKSDVKTILYKKTYNIPFFSLIYLLII